LWLKFVRSFDLIGGCDAQDFPFLLDGVAGRNTSDFQRRLRQYAGAVDPDTLRTDRGSRLHDAEQYRRVEREPTRWFVEYLGSVLTIRDPRHEEGRPRNRPPGLLPDLVGQHLGLDQQHRPPLVA